MKAILSKIHTIKQAIPKIKKESTNPHFKSKYADLDSIMEVVQPILNDQKVVIYHSLVGDVLKTYLVDIESNEMIETSYPINLQLDNQKIGSALTYGRRYSVCLLLSIVADDDDDGNSTSGKPSPPKPTPPKQDKNLEKLQNEIYTAIKDKQAEMIMNEIAGRWVKAKDKLSIEVWNQGVILIRQTAEKNGFDIKEIK